HRMMETKSAIPRARSLRMGAAPRMRHGLNLAWQARRQHSQPQPPPLVKSLVNKGDILDPPAQLQAWREQGADRLDPVRFQLIDALARRAPAYTGAARQMLDARLADLLQNYASDVAKAGEAVTGRGDAETAGQSSLRELASLIAHQSPSRQPGVMAGNMPLSGASYPELAAMDYFRG